jgi:hypothetical protein
MKDKKDLDLFDLEETAHKLNNLGFMLYSLSQMDGLKDYFTDFDGSLSMISNLIQNEAKIIGSILDNELKKRRENV